MQDTDQSLSSMSLSPPVDFTENGLISKIAETIEKLNNPDLSSKERKKHEADIRESKMNLLVLLGKSLFWHKASDFLDEVNQSFPFTSKDSPHRYCQLIQFRPHIYGVYTKSIKYINKKKFSDSVTEWSCVKVGFTQTDGDPTNRANTVKSLIVRSFRNNGYNIKLDDIIIIFCLPIAFTNYKLFRDVEESVRRVVGVSVPATAAKTLNLPVPTEWVYSPILRIKECTIPLESELDSSTLTKKGSFTGGTPANLALDLVNECAAADAEGETDLKETGDLLQTSQKSEKDSQKSEKDSAKLVKKKSLKMSGEKSES